MSHSIGRDNQLCMKKEGTYSDIRRANVPQALQELMGCSKKKEMVQVSEREEEWEGRDVPKKVKRFCGWTVFQRLASSSRFGCQSSGLEPVGRRSSLPGRALMVGRK